MSEQSGSGSVERPVKAGQFEMAWGSDVVAQMLREFGVDYITLTPAPVTGDSTTVW